LLKPPRTLKIAANRPQGISGPSAIDLTPDPGIASWQGSSARTVNGAIVEFVETSTGLKASSRLAFDFPGWLLFVAALAGIGGVLAARRAGLFQQGRTFALLEILAAVIGSVLLYLALVLGWVPGVADTPSLIGWLPALLIGIIGGYGGEGTFQFVMKAVNWLHSQIG
jgi:uncharacterized membrane protein YeaQ/YmgE (transglycosylase-associated protein family)